MSRPVRVCFHASRLWPLWSEGRIAFTGGAEVQQAQLATGLAGLGFDVTVVSCDYGQPSPVAVRGVRVLKTYRIESGPPVLRFFHPRLTRTWAALQAAAADVYYVRGAGLEAGVTYEVARRRGAPFVFGAAHDHDARAGLPLLSSPRDRWLYRRALRGAAAVIAQSEAQRSLFRSEFGIDSEVIRNLVEPPAVPADAGANASVVWLATYKAAKRPEWFVELARALPNHRFAMHGVVPVAPEPDTEFRRAVDAAGRLPNLTVGAYLDRDGIARLMAGAALFVHTSPVEGFPNTVLEAWASAVPTVTCVDPDGVVGRERLGETAGDLTSLIASVEGWMRSPARRREAGARARAYAEREHAPAAVLARLGATFRRAAQRSR